MITILLNCIVSLGILTAGIIMFIKGRPYKGIQLAIHLLLSFGLMIYSGIKMYNASGVGSTNYPGTTITITTIASMLLLIITGFLLIRERFNRLFMNLLHGAATVGLLTGLVMQFLLHE